MVLEAAIKNQLNQYLQLMEGNVQLKVSAGSDQLSKDLLAFIDEIASLSSQITVEKHRFQERQASVSTVLEKIPASRSQVFLLVTNLHHSYWPCCR
ncbi:alkyl hydroperoxide reductase protein F [Sporolactobacillus inulinus]|uniref:Alkyl hydroperoxide reductase protein F n=1 Tax=Sporolactobacillus inulinus TaxID=2078 RepID=A0A4Y1Z985_9BACL|nr:alkyl hydroperoxide reductase protein F [Sporolactobacillus inulinus]